MPGRRPINPSGAHPVRGKLELRARYQSIGEIYSEDEGRQGPYSYRCARNRRLGGSRQFLNWLARVGNKKPRPRAPLTLP